VFDDVDQALRDLLIQELPISNDEVDIEFDRPKREWSARLSRPTLNLFLYDIHENQKLRQAQPMWQTFRGADGTVTQQRKPVRVDVHYMITVWAAEPEDEHRLLARTMMALFRYPHLPDEVLPPSLQHQQRKIELMVAQPNALQNPVDIWTVLDNEMGPAVELTVTMALDPYAPTTTPLVVRRELRFAQDVRRVPRARREGEQEIFFAVRGTLVSKEPLEEARVVLVEQGIEIIPRPDGEFLLGRLRRGAYTLEVSAEGHVPARHQITVPDDSYDIEVK
jgi:hypothetical protein